MTKNENLISVKEAAEMRGVSKRSVQKLVANGKLTVQKIGSSFYLDREDVLQLGKPTGGRLVKQSKKVRDQSSRTFLGGCSDREPFNTLNTAKPVNNNNLQVNSFPAEVFGDDLDFIEKVDKLPDEALLTVSDAAHFLDIPPYQVKQQIENNVLKSVLIGGQRLISKRDLVEFEDWLIAHNEKIKNSAEYKSWQANVQSKQSEWESLNASVRCIRLATGFEKPANPDKCSVNSYKQVLVDRITGKLKQSPMRFDLRPIVEFIESTRIERILPDGVSKAYVSDLLQRHIENLSSEEFVNKWIDRIENTFKKTQNVDFLKSWCDFISSELENIETYKDIYRRLNTEN